MAVRALQDEIALDLKALTERQMVNMGILASDKATSQAGMLWKLLFGQQDVANNAANETAKTTEVAAGNGLRLAAQSMAAAEGAAISKATNEKEGMADAIKAAKGAYAAVAGIPIVGPVLAPIAAGVAFTAVEALGSFAQGANVVPQDMIAQVHAGERIIPAADNSALMAAVGAGGTGGGGDVHAIFQINAIDPGTGAKFLQSQMHNLAKQLKAHMRDNPQLARGFLEPV
jgi:hypothetical protein